MHTTALQCTFSTCQVHAYASPTLWLSWIDWHPRPCFRVLHKVRCICAGWIESLRYAAINLALMLDQAPGDIIDTGIVPRFVQSVSNSDYQTAELAMRLLHNLSFHEKGRKAMVSAGAIPKVSSTYWVQHAVFSPFSDNFNFHPSLFNLSSNFVDQRLWHD